MVSFPYSPEAQALNIKVAYSSFVAIGIAIIELIIIFVLEKKRRVIWKKTLNVVNLSNLFAMIGAMINHCTRAYCAYIGETNEITIGLQGIGTSFFIVCHMTHLYFRSLAIIDVKVKKFFQVVGWISTVCTAVIIVTSFTLWEIKGFRIYNIFYIILMLTVLAFDIFFSYIFIKQLRHFEQLLGVKDQQMKFVARLGLLLVAASILGFIVYAASVVVPVRSDGISLAMTAMAHHVMFFFGHVVFYGKLSHGTGGSRRNSTRKGTSSAGIRTASLSVTTESQQQQSKSQQESRNDRAATASQSLQI